MPARSKSSRQTKPRNSNKDAISLLEHDHQTLRRLLKRLEKEGSEDILDEVATELKAHTQIEQEIFYPAFRDSLKSEKDEHLYFEALEEHHIVDMVLSEIKEQDEDSEEFDAKAKVLMDLVEHHAEEEETEMFPKAKKLMRADELRELGEELRRRKEDLIGGRGTRTGRRAA